MQRAGGSTRAKAESPSVEHCREKKLWQALAQERNFAISALFEMTAVHRAVGVTSPTWDRYLAEAASG